MNTNINDEKVEEIINAVRKILDDKNKDVNYVDEQLEELSDLIHMKFLS